MLQAEAVTDFAREGTGPVFAGKLFPFVFITIACGALSGFHALIASGTTPKMVAKESQVRMIGYGGMLMESFVAISALIAACVIDQGLYFAMNSPAGATGGDRRARRGVRQHARLLDQPGRPAPRPPRRSRRTTLISRTGGAPTLAFGISQIFTDAFGGGLAAFWYHFAIMFEALFILTAVDAGTRVGRFMLQDTVGNVWQKYGDLSWKPASWSASAVVVGLWGYMLYVGVTDPLGGINQLFPLFGIANQLLAAIALTLCVTLLIKHGKLKYAWVPGIALVWDLIVTMTASYQKVFSDDPKIGYFEQRSVLPGRASTTGEVLPPGDRPWTRCTRSSPTPRVNGILQAIFAVLTLIVVVANAVVDLDQGDPGRRPAHDRGAGDAVAPRRAVRLLRHRGGEGGRRRVGGLAARATGREAGDEGRRAPGRPAGCAGTSARSPARPSGTTTSTHCREQGDVRR